MGRYAKAGVTVEELKNRIDDACGTWYIIWQDQIQTDLSKLSAGVEFDCENVTEPDDEGWSMNGFTNGYDVLPNGVPVCWCGAGGDWECPIAFCLYIGEDGEFHAYVPKDENVYNKETNAAFGNNDDYDEYKKYKFDMDKMRDEAARNIAFKD